MIRGFNEDSDLEFRYKSNAFKTFCEDFRVNVESSGREWQEVVRLREPSEVCSRCI